jgi:beta-xylosidase
VAGTTPSAPAEAATATEQPAATGTTDTAGTFSNPVLRGDFADPFVLKEGATYYAYATNASGRNIQVATSPDLVKWTLLSDAMPSLPAWAKLGGSLVWAPEVMKIGDKFVLYYTARDKASNKQCVGVATSDKPEGKYRDTNPAPLVCQAPEGGTIDASPYRDGDKLYLYYKNDGNCCGQATYLYVSEMSPDGLSLVGEPTRLVRNDKAWEGRVVEAPTMWKQEGKYYLFFSANNYAGFEYSVGYANCETPTGPCEDAPENPILASRMKQKPLVIGPGHQSIIEDDDGEAWLVYHVWDVTSAGLRGDSRFMWIDRLAFEGGKPVVKGPTSVPQPVP